MFNRLLIHTVMLGTAASCVGFVGDIRISAFGWISALAVAFLAIAYSASVGRTGLQVLWPWLTYTLAMAAISSYPGSLHQGIIAATPLVVLLAAKPPAKVHYQLLLRYLVILACFLAGLVTYERLTDPAFTFAPQAITAVLLGYVFITQYFITKRNRWLLLWILCLAITIVGVNRGPMLTLLLAPVLIWSPAKRSVRFVLIAFAGLTAAILFNASFVQEKLFLSGDGSISGLTELEDLNTSGRIIMWPLLWDEWLKSKWLGHGVASSPSFLLGYSDRFAHPHNDYLRLLYEQGLFGLVAFLIFILAIARALLKSHVTIEDWQRPWGMFSINLLIAFLLLMITDNVYLYASYFGNTWFLIIGLVLCATPKESYRYRSLSGHIDTAEPQNTLGFLLDRRSRV